MSERLVSVGIHLSASGNAASVIAGLAKSLGLAHVNAKMVQSALANIKGPAALAIGGAAAFTIGKLGLDALKTPLEEASKYQIARTNLGLTCIGDSALAEAEKFAHSMYIIGSSYTDNLNMLREGIGIFRTAGDANPLKVAEMVAPVMAKIRALDSTLDDSTKASYHHQELAMLRFAEMSGGLSSPERMNALLDAGYKAIKNSGGNVNWEQLRQFKARASGAGFNLSDKAVFSELEPIIGELKVSTTGVNLRTSYNRLTGGMSITPAAVAEQMFKMGLWNPKDVEVGKGGAVKTHGKNPLIDAALFSEDPVEWYNKHIRPYYDLQKFTGSQRIDANNRLFGPSAAGMWNVIDRQEEAIKKSITAQAKMAGINPSYVAAGGTLAGQKVDAESNFRNLMIDLGKNVLPLAIAALKILNPMIAGLAKFVEAHPTMTKIAITAVALGSAFLVVAGPLAIIVGIFGTLAPLFAGIAPVLMAVTAAFGLTFGQIAIMAGVAFGIGYMIGTLIVVLVKSWPQMVKFGQDMAVWWTNLWGSVAKWWVNFSNAAGAFFTNIVGWFMNLPGNLWNAIRGQPTTTSVRNPVGAPPPKPVQVTVPVTVENHGPDIKTHVYGALGVNKPNKGETNHNASQTWHGPSVAGAR
jgi:hypothetical protein